MGFMVVDALAAVHGLHFQGSRFSGELAQGRVEGERLFLFKPLTYMNRSGLAVQPFLAYYRISPSEIVVVHDDLDMELGRLKFARGGGHGGHNGVRSVVAALGTKGFPRLKLGIGRPEPGYPVDKYVLSRFSSDEMALVEEVVATAVDGVAILLKKGLDAAMNRYNGIDLRQS